MPNLRGKSPGGPVFPSANLGKNACYTQFLGPNCGKCNLSFAGGIFKGAKPADLPVEQETLKAEGLVK